MINKASMLGILPSLALILSAILPVCAHAVSAPSNLQVQKIDHSNASLTWQDLAVDETHYRIQVSKRLGGTTTWSSYMSLPDLAPNTENLNFTINTNEGGLYKWRLRAYNGNAGSSWIYSSPNIELEGPEASAPPTTTILVPATGGSAIAGQAISFSGSASTPTTGAHSFEWQSDIDGVFATSLGTSFGNLSVGNHTITLQVTSAEGLTANDSIALTITPNVSITFPIIEAEDYDGMSGVGIQAGLRINSFDTGDYFYFSDVDLQGANSIDITLSTLRLGAALEIRLDSPSGPLIGTLNITPTATWEIPAEETQTTDLVPTYGVHDLYFVGLTAGSAISNIAKINSFQLANGGLPPSTIPPTAIIDYPSNGDTFMVGEAIEFFGTGSTTESSALQYEWSSNIDGVFATWEDASFSSLSMNNHEITFRVTDANGLSAQSSVTITVQPMMTMPIVNNNAFLMAMGPGSRIEIHAADTVKASWVQLANGHTAPKDSTQIKIDNQGEPTNWEVGDEIVIASSYYHERRAEERTITAISVVGNIETISLDSALSYMHYGAIETYSRINEAGETQTWEVDMRAEVGLLSRNVTLKGDADSTSDLFGGHVMTMMGAKMHISGTEFKHMGQDGKLGRYPIHWHNSGDVTGQYLLNNSIHKSFHKGITIHGTNRAWVENNIIHHTLGHGVFLENGTEVENVFMNNLVMTQKNATTPVIASDKFSVASYWSNNPQNHFINNHAAGSRGSGFWIAGNRTAIADAQSDPAYAGYIPRQQPIGLFIGNAAHSNLKTSVGVLGREMTGMGLNVGQEIIEDQINSLDHDNYAELHVPDSETENDILNLHISDFTSYMNEDIGLFLRSFGGHLSDIKLADNGLGLLTTGGQRIEDSVIIGNSGNSRAGHRKHLESIEDWRYGVGLYTDSIVMDDILFTDFRSEFTNESGLKIRDRVLTNRTGANNSTLHVMEDVSLQNTDASSYFMSGGRKENRDANELSVSTVGFIDAVGAFTGIEGAQVLGRLRNPDNEVEYIGSPLHTTEIVVAGFNRPPFQTENPAVSPSEAQLDAHVTDQQIAGHFKIHKDEKLKRITRSDGPSIRTRLENTSDQLVVYPYQDNSYATGQTISYHFEWEETASGDFDFIIRDFQEAQQVYFIVDDVPSNTTIQGSTQVASLTSLLNYDATLGTAHYRELSDGRTVVHVMMSATDMSYIPQVEHLATIDNRIFWDSVRIRGNGTGANTPEGSHALSEVEFRPFIKELETNYISSNTDWRNDPVEFLEPAKTESDWINEITARDPFGNGFSTSQTIANTSTLPRWSNPATWGGHIPSANDIVVIKDGQQVVLDQSASVKGIIITGMNSALIIEDTPGVIRQLTSDYVLAISGGMFQAGTEADPLDTEFTLELTGDDPALVLPVQDIVSGNSSESISFAQ